MSGFWGWLAELIWLLLKLLWPILIIFIPVLVYNVIKDYKKEREETKRRKQGKQKILKEMTLKSKTLSTDCLISIRNDVYKGWRRLENVRSTGGIQREIVMILPVEELFASLDCDTCKAVYNIVTDELNRRNCS